MIYYLFIIYKGFCLHTMRQVTTIHNTELYGNIFFFGLTFSGEALPQQCHCIPTSQVTFLLCYLAIP